MGRPISPRRDWDALEHDIKPINTAVNADAARAALDDLTEKWGTKCGPIIRLWNNAWEKLTPFLDYDIDRLGCGLPTVQYARRRRPSSL